MNMAGKGVCNDEDWAGVSEAFAIYAADAGVDIVLWSLVDCNSSAIGKFNSSSVFCMNELQALAKYRPSVKFLPLATEQQYLTIVQAAKSRRNLIQVFQEHHWKVQ